MALEQAETAANFVRAAAEDSRASGCCNRLAQAPSGDTASRGKFF
jgi:hypothetical protein